MNPRPDAYAELGLWTGERLGSLLGTAARTWGERDFLAFGHTRLSYAALERWVTSTAWFLVDSGVRPGDRVLVQSGNCLDLVVLQLAAWRIGAIDVPVVPIYRRHELRAIIADTRPDLIAAAPVAGSRSPAAEIEEVLADLGHRPRRRVLLGADAPAPGWDLAPTAPGADAPPRAGELPEPAAPEDCCAILFTSGTTSAPKGARVSGRAVLANLANWRSVLGITADDVALTGAPLAHIGGLQSLLVPMSCGGRTVILPHWDGDLAVAAIEAERATFMSGAPVFLADLVERYERGASAGHRLRLFLSGGAPTPPHLIARAEAVGISASRCYGMTETVGTVTQAPPQAPFELRAHTDGRLLPGTEVEIVDDRREQLPLGAIGHLRIRSAQLMLGYTDPDLTASQLDAEGWFYPGDLGHLDPAGHLTMVGRSKDIINRGGEKFAAQDIEAALITHPLIREAAVLGLPDDRLGEIVGAFVVLAEGAHWAGPQDVLRHLEAVRLARPKFPVQWFVRDALPRTASGKVRKNVLLEFAAQSPTRPA